ncbi:MAG: LicD family protein [Eubacteriales bacterium]|nr:LicD family protein [Eubacteriales bacterium]
MPLTDNAYGMEAIQQSLWNMMREVDAFCRAEKIEYTALGGTMLGAVREQGFIPWDDDIDLALTDSALERFIALFPQTSQLYTVSQSDTWVARVVRKDRAQGGEFIDLFRFAPVKKNALAQKYRVFQLMTLQGMLKTGVTYENYSLSQRLLLRTTAFLGKSMSREQKLRRYRMIARDTRHCRNDLLFIPDECFSCLKLHYPASVAERYTDAPFEDGVIRLSQQADLMLRAQYGDYMTPPPQEERVSTHDAQRKG